MKRRKGATISLGIMISIVVMFLLVGTKIMLDINSNFDRQAEEIHSAHDSIIMMKKSYQESFTTYLQEDTRIEEFEVKDVVMLGDAHITYDGGLLSTYFLFENLEEQGKMNQVKIEEKCIVSPEEAIYLPMVMKTKGFKAGETITFENDVWSKTYTIAGFFRSTNFGIENSGGLRFYLNKEGYKKLYLEKGLSTEVLIRCKDTKDTTPVYNEFQTFIKEHMQNMNEYNAVWGCEYYLMKTAYTFMGLMGAAVIMGFAFIIAIITLLVIRFQIHNNIDHSIQKIGILGALGYQSREIVSVFSLEYFVTGVVGAIIGIGLSYIVTPAFGSALMNSNGLRWSSNMAIGMDLLISVGILFIVGMITRLSAGRAKQYSPQVALTQGMKNHSFRKNHFPLDKKGSLTFHLAGKEWFQLKKQNIMVVLCIAGVTFATVFACLLYTSFVSDIWLLKKMLGMELADIQVKVENQVDPYEVQKEIAAMDGVRKTNIGGVASAYVDQIAVTVNTYENYDILETENVYEGRFCEYDNEVVITGVMAKQLHKSIGDVVSVSIQGITYEYIITGITQAMSDSGRVIKLTKEGFKKLVPGAELQECYIYLEKGVSRKEFIQELKEYFGLKKEKKTEQYERYKEIAEEKIRTMMAIYGVTELDYSICVDGQIISGNSRSYKIHEVIDVYETGQSVMSSIQSMLRIVTLAIVFVTGGIILLLLTMIIRMLLLRKRKQYGILRSMGYTTKELMIQIAASLLPSVIIGVITGTIFCCFLAGPITTKILSAAGISNMQFAVSPFKIILVGVFIVLFAFIIAMLQARKVRKLSAYELLTE